MAKMSHRPRVTPKTSELKALDRLNTYDTTLRTRKAPSALMAMHEQLGNMSPTERKAIMAERSRKAALTRAANRYESILKRRAKLAGFDTVEAWQGWLRNILTSGMVRLAKDHPLREMGLVIDPLKYARILLRAGLYVPEDKAARRFIEKYEEPLKEAGFGSFKNSPGVPATWDLMDPKFEKPHIGRPKKHGH